jgi:hypothetical protein
MKGDPTGSKNEVAEFITRDRNGSPLQDNGRKLVFHTDLQCFVDRIEYDPISCVGTLYMGLNSCCDMTGCVRFFQHIDERVSLIRTYQDNDVRRADTFYVRNDGGGDYYAASKFWIGRWGAKLSRLASDYAA